jgi:formylmethanofuran dehydrogenase subunit D
MPTFKGVPVEVEVAMNEKVLSSVELVQMKCRGEI